VFRRLALHLSDQLGLSGPDQPSKLAANDELVFFPTLARRETDGSVLIRIHGWLYQPEDDSRKREALLRTLAKLFALGDSDPFPDDAYATFQTRAKPFLVTNEGCKRVAISIGGRVFVMPRSGSNGHFAGDLLLDAETAKRAASASDDAIEFHATLPPSPGTTRDRAIRGKAALLASTGVSVVSDIDDTIRHSSVQSKRLLIRSTFTEPFRPVDGMPGLLRRLAPRADDAVHYLSAAPWQLGAPIEAFLREHGFPTGSLHLRAIRLKDRSLLQLFKEPTEHKLTCVRKLMARWPERRFILVGDSGEQDPEIFALLAREHPGRVDHVYIRDTTGESMTSSRYKRSLWAAMDERWTLFVDASVVKP